MPKVKIRISREAHYDFEEIGEYTKDMFGRVQATTYLKKLDDTIALLETNPRLGRDMLEVRDTLRAMDSEQHVIYYSFDDDRITVLRILHKARNIPPLLNDMIQ